VLAAVAAAILVWARLAATTEGTSSAPTGTGGRPNVLLIVTDDQREGLEVMPDTRRWLVQGGTTFPWAFATTPVCCPSRASIMTGRYAHNHGVRTNRPGQANNLEQESTLQYQLQRAGYRTAMFGKYLNKWPLEQDPPHFDEWADFTRTPLYAPDAYVGGPWNVNGEVRQVSEYTTTFIGDQAVRFIQNSGDTPWFLYLAPPAPHRPYVAEPRYEDAAVPPWEGNPAVRELDKSDKPTYLQDSGRTLEDGQSHRIQQFRTLMSVDDMVGRVFGAVTESGRLDDTLVIFISDQGASWAEHGFMGKHPPYLQATRVPFLARWPGHLDEGAVDQRLVANIDVAPTVLDAVGLAPSTPLDGKSLLQEGWTRDRLVLENFSVRPSPMWSSTVTRAFQYVEYYELDGETISFVEYYDLAADEWQLVNLFHDGDPANDPDASALHEVLADDRSCAGSNCP
jgi:arylsulfatase A-like enzyme